MSGPPRTRSPRRQPGLYYRDDPELLKAKSVTAHMLYRSDQPTDEQVTAGIAAWAIVHGVASLWLSGNLPERLGQDPEAIARAVARHLQVDGRDDAQLGGPGAEAGSVSP